MKNNRPVSSLVDYVITHYDNYSNINDMYVYDISEFSDHSPITFSMKINGTFLNATCDAFDKILWDISKSYIFWELVEIKHEVFNDINDKLVSNTSDINQSFFRSCS